MYAVEVLGIATVVADKELRATSVLASVCHREHATVVILTLCICLALDCPTWTTCAIANRATTLNDKVRDYAVKGKAVRDILQNPGWMQEKMIPVRKFMRFSGRELYKVFLLKSLKKSLQVVICCVLA